MKGKIISIILDLPIILCIILFMSLALMNYRTELSLSMFSFFIAVGLLASYITTVLLRNKINSYKKKEIEAEAQLESTLIESDKLGYKEVKKRALEDLIVNEINLKWPDAKVLKNVVIPKPNNATTEIDVLVFHTKGIFVIEAKNFNAQIEGSWKNDQSLVAVYPNNSRYPFYNPVMQNEKHCKYLQNVIEIESGFLKNIVVFGSNAQVSFKDVPYNAYICKVAYLVKSMEKLYKINSKELDKFKVDFYYDTVLNLVNKTV